MNPDPQSAKSPASPSGEYRIDQLCTEFESAWKSGRRERIEDWLPRVPESDRAGLLRELILVEVELRRAAGESPQADEYQQRFPDRSEIVDTAFADMARELNDASFTATLIRNVNQETSCRQTAGGLTCDRNTTSRRDSQLPTIPWYLVECELGRGGMGVVYRCRHEPTDQLVALKLMLRGRGAGIEELARFRIEAEALACLDHRNIAEVIDVGVVDGCPYFVTEYAANGTIADFATKTDKSIDWCVDAIRQVALGVHHAHTRTLIHRDIKPANILVMADERPKITDFGLVKFGAPVRDLADASRAPQFNNSFNNFDTYLKQFATELADQYGSVDEEELSLVDSLRRACLDRTGLPAGAIDAKSIEQFLDSCRQGSSNDALRASSTILPILDDLTRSGTIIGSPKFMSPEQLLGDHSAIGPRTDVYGLGATLYWLLTGEPVNWGRNLTELIESACTRFPKPLTELNARVSDALDCVVWKAIQKDPPRRYDNCKVLAEELWCCLDGKKPAAQKSRERREAPRAAKDDDLFLRAFPPKSS